MGEVVKNEGAKGNDDNKNMVIFGSEQCTKMGGDGNKVY